MRIRRSLIVVALVLGVVLVISASCRTLVQIVDEAGLPVRAASVRPVWLSVNGEVSLTDSDGYATLDDAWSLLGAPRWVFIDANGTHWEIDYPPPKIIRLDPSRALPLPSGASQQGAAADAPKAARR